MCRHFTLGVNVNFPTGLLIQDFYFLSKLQCFCQLLSSLLFSTKVGFYNNKIHAHIVDSYSSSYMILGKQLSVQRGLRIFLFHL